MRILFFAQLKDATGCEELELAAAAPLNADELWARLLERFPKLSAHRKQIRWSRNWEYATADTLFSNDDEVALIPPVSGG